jgi:hypothetical protein
MAKIPDSTQHSLTYKVHARARERWPALTRVDVRFRAGFAYLDGVLAKYRAVVQSAAHGAVCGEWSSLEVRRGCQVQAVGSLR